MKIIGALAYMEWRKLCCMRWFLWIYLILLLICSATIRATAFICPIVYYTIVIAPMGYDEQNKGEYLMGALPVTRSQIVTAKYLMLVVTFLCINGLLYSCNQLLYWGLGEWDSPNRFSISFLLALGVGVVLFTGIALPLNLILGPTRARLYMMILYFGSYSAITGLFGIFSDGMDQAYLMGILTNASQDLWVYLLGMIIVILLGSYMVSCTFYNRRQFD